MTYGQQDLVSVQLRFFSAGISVSGIVELSQGGNLMHREILQSGGMARALQFDRSDSVEIFFHDPQFRYKSLTKRILVDGGSINEVLKVDKHFYTDSQRPNIIILLADDLGYGSVEGYGLNTELINTPNIRRLAEEGIKFTNAYTPSSVCSPTRYGLLTGRCDFRTGEQYGVLNVRAPLHIPTERASLGKLIKEQGYRTAIIGKWHLGYQSGSTTDYTKELTPGPLDIGFDYQWAVPSNAGDATGVWVENRFVYGLISDYNDLEEWQKHPERSYYNELMLKIPAPFRADSTIMPTIKIKAIEWLENQPEDSPFFLYLPTTGIHVPVTPSGSFRGKSQLGTWGDYLMELDDLVGSILEVLDRKGLSENTIVLFTSDNGGSISTAEAKYADSLGVKINGNTKSGKGSIWQGGFKVPYIVRWTGVVPSGKVNDQPISLLDTYSTLSSFFGAEYDVTAAIAEDSYNILPYWFNQNRNTVIRKDLILTSVTGIQSLILNDFKFIDGIARQPGFSNMDPWLTDLRTDPLEKRNILWQDTTYRSLFADILSNRTRAKGTRPFITGNNKPQIVTREIELSETYADNEMVGVLDSKDLEGDRMTYYPLYGQMSDLFQIDKAGRIFVKNASVINGYEEGSWKIKVQCSDGLDIDTAQIILFKGSVDAKILSTAHCSKRSNPLISPNPVEDKFNITFEGVELTDSTVELIDLSGKRISKFIKNGTIDVSDLSSGIYTLRFLHQTVEYQLKLIKN